MRLQLPSQSSSCQTIIQSSNHDYLIAFLRYCLGLLTRHRAVQSTESKTLERASSTLSRSSSFSITAHIKIDFDKPEQLQKQWNYVNESIRRRIWQLACLCRSIDLNANLRYDLDDNEEEKNSGSSDLGTQNGLAITKDSLDYKTPEPRKRGKSILRSEEIRSNDVHKKNGEEFQTPKKNCLDSEKQRIITPSYSSSSSLIEQVTASIDQASMNSKKSSIAMSRLIQILLPQIIEETKQLGQFVTEIHSDIKTSSLSNTSSLFQLENWMSLQSNELISESVPSSIDRLTENFTHEIFELFLDFYQRLELFVVLLIPKLSESFKSWLSISFIQILSLLLQSIGLFLQREKNYVKSTR